VEWKKSAHVPPPAARFSRCATAIRAAQPFMKTLAAALLSLVFILHSHAQEGAVRPNVIFILADDLGTGNVGCYGADHDKTPCIDKLAASGTRFTHCYTAS
jgi:arylsulfatase A